MAGAQHGMCELTARHGNDMGAAWAQHAMCEYAFFHRVCSYISCRVLCYALTCDTVLCAGNTKVDWPTTSKDVHSWDTSVWCLDFFSADRLVIVNTAFSSAGPREARRVTLRCTLITLLPLGTPSSSARTDATSCRYSEEQNTPCRGDRQRT